MSVRTGWWPRMCIGTIDNLKYTRTPIYPGRLHRQISTVSNMVNISHQSRASSASAPLGISKQALARRTAWDHKSIDDCSPFHLESIDGWHLALQHGMSRPMVRVLRSEGTCTPFNNHVGLLSLLGGWSPAVLTRKVGLPASGRQFPSASATPRFHSRACVAAPLSTPAISRPRIQNTRACTPRTTPIPSSWNNTRFCSSHASSSLVKMATDRDILSDEYVSPLTYIAAFDASARNR